VFYQYSENCLNKELADRTQNIKQKLGIVKTLNKELTDRTQNIKQKLGIVKTVLIKNWLIEYRISNRN
jgi:ABC-type Na+ transport system ATPase subunit NatA